MSPAANLNFLGMPLISVLGVLAVVYDRTGMNEQLGLNVRVVRFSFEVQHGPQRVAKVA